MNWAKQGAHVTAVDLNPVAIAQTKRRFELLGLRGDIREMDANSLQFDDASFDYVYSWGVLHHVYSSRHHLTDSESSPGYAARIFSFASGTLSTNVCIGVFP